MDKKEQMKEYMKEYRKKNKDHIKEKNKEWYERNKEHHKTHYQNNKEKWKEYHKEYRKTDKEIKRSRIKSWKRSGIIVEDWDELYDYYINTTNCEYCDVELIEGNFGANHRCLDHNHNTGEVRGVICHTCNVRDVFAISLVPSVSE